jgi:hypothetical protein
MRMIGTIGPDSKGKLDPTVIGDLEPCTLEAQGHPVTKTTFMVLGTPPMQSLLVGRSYPFLLHPDQRGSINLKNLRAKETPHWPSY